MGTEEQVEHHAPPAYPEPAWWDVWPVAAQALELAGVTWPAELAAFDAAWWSNQARHRNVERPGYGTLAQRWGWVSSSTGKGLRSRVRRLLADVPWTSWEWLRERQGALQAGERQPVEGLPVVEGERKPRTDQDAWVREASSVCMRAILDVEDVDYRTGIIREALGGWLQEQTFRTFRRVLRSYGVSKPPRGRALHRAIVEGARAADQVLSEGMPRLSEVERELLGV